MKREGGETFHFSCETMDSNERMCIQAEHKCSTGRKRGKCACGTITASRNDEVTGKRARIEERHLAILYWSGCLFKYSLIHPLFSLLTWADCLGGSAPCRIMLSSSMSSSSSRGTRQRSEHRDLPGPLVLRSFRGNELPGCSQTTTHDSAVVMLGSVARRFENSVFSS